MEAVVGFTVMSDRVALLKINSRSTYMNIIQFYVPRTESTEAEIEDFYQTLEVALKLSKNHEVNI